jgi:hypothetical protein
MVLAFWNWFTKYEVNDGECMVILIQIAFHESSEVSAIVEKTMIYVRSNLTFCTRSL